MTLIHNPLAGSRCGPGELRAMIEAAGHKVRLRSTKEKGWSKALKKKADLVAVAGGDGTVGKVARRLVHSGMPIAVLPMGTANNISRSLGLDGLEIAELVSAWNKSRRAKLDAGCAVGPWGSRYFIEGVGMGLLPRLMPEVDSNPTMSQLPAAEFKVAYALQVLREHLETSRAMQINALLDGQDISGEYLLLEAMNTRFVGPNLFLAPAGVHDAGMLDVAFVRHKDRAKFARYLARWQAGQTWPPDFGVARGRCLEIEWTGFALHIDDKVWPKPGERTPRPPGLIELTVERGALTFLVPPRRREKSQPETKPPTRYPSQPRKRGRAV